MVIWCRSNTIYGTLEMSYCQSCQEVMIDMRRLHVIYAMILQFQSFVNNEMEWVVEIILFVVYKNLFIHCSWCHIHWNGNVVILMKFSSLAALVVFKNHIFQCSQWLKFRQNDDIFVSVSADDLVIKRTRGRVNEWVIKFNSLSWTADAAIHVIHIRCVITSYTLES